jgi:hypothetical protein
MVFGFSACDMDSALLLQVRPVPAFIRPPARAALSDGCRNFYDSLLACALVRGIGPSFDREEPTLVGRWLHVLIQHRLLPRL